MSFEKAKRRIELRLMGARFIQFAPIEAGKLDHESDDQVYYLGSYFAHRIGNQFLVSGDYRFIMSNGFLASYTYNLGLIFLMFHGNRPVLDRALRSNFKKFYAECCLGEANCLIGRALLIETLSYEQEDMRRVFAASAASAELADKASGLSDFIAQILNLHEMGHYFEHRAGQAWLTEMRPPDDGRLGARMDDWRDKYSSELVAELICDAFAVARLLRHAEVADQNLELAARARMLVFGFLCFRELVSLQISAEQTALAAKEEDKNIQVGSEKRSKFQFGYKIGKDPSMYRRSEEVLAMIEEEAAHRGFELYGEDGYFPLPPNTAEILSSAFERFMDIDDSADTPPGTATNSYQRGIAQLIAESLHGCDDGAEHLLWRSKQFRVGAEQVDP